MAEAKETDCPGCKKPLSGRTLQAREKKWHVECWKCKDCDKPFFDGTNLNDFFHKGETVVCGPCADIGVPCGGCQGLLSFREAGGILKAVNKFWHVKCFACTTCKNPITKLRVSSAGDPYCDSCPLPEGKSSESTQNPETSTAPEPSSSPAPEPVTSSNTGATEPAPTVPPSTMPAVVEKKEGLVECWGCKKVIEGRITTAMDHSWHPSCFVCAECKNGFGGKSFFTKNGQPVCDNCHVNSAPVCGGCTNKVTGRYLTAFDKKWHPECFICTECRKPFEGGKFKLLPYRPGVPFCAPCAETINNSSS